MPYSWQTISTSGKTSLGRGRLWGPFKANPELTPMSSIAARTRSVKEALDALPGPPKGGTSPKNQLRQMKPKHHELMTLLLAGVPQSEAGRILGFTPGRVTQIVGSPIFRQLHRKIIEARYEAVIAGEFGPIAQAKLEAPSAMKRLIGVSRMAKSDAVKRQALCDVLNYAGYEPVKKTENLNIDVVVDSMTEDEQQQYIATGEWPARLAGQLQQLGYDAPIAKPAEDSKAIEADFEEVADRVFEDELESRSDEDLDDE